MKYASNFKPIEDVRACLQTDPFKYIVHLKMLEAYPRDISWRVETVDNHTGVVLLLPVSTSPYDSRTYPTADWIVLLAAPTAAVAEKLVQGLPRQNNLVFKLVDELSKGVVLDAFPAQRTRAFVSFTARGKVDAAGPPVEISKVLDQRLIPSFQANGYTLGELNNFFQQGAMSFSIIATEPLSTCFTFGNYGQIWEIGGVYTVPSHRRQGLAGKVVTAAVNTLLDQGKIPRYQVDESNRSSMNLADKLGLERFVTTEHYIYSPNASTEQPSERNKTHRY